MRDRQPPEFGHHCQAYVTCKRPNGVEQDNYFTLVYQERTGTFGAAKKGIAYLLDDDPTAASYTPFIQYNSSGGSNTVTRTSTGVFSVQLPGFTSNGGDVQVTAVEAPRIGRCQTTAWSTGVGSPGMTVDVDCYDEFGNPVDQYFELEFAIGDPLAVSGSATTRGAWAWADQPGTTSVYTPALEWQYNGFGTGNLTAQKTGTGTYTVTIPGSPSFNHSIAVVTADSVSNDNCNIVEWIGTTIAVACYAPGGATADSEFNIAFEASD